jgi:hypothetical protein
VTEVGETDGARVRLPFAWRPNLERLKAEARAASDTGRSDPHALAEAECWIDLVDAELAAQAGARQEPHVIATTKQLKYWKHDLQSVWKVLEEAASGRPTD